MITPEFKDGILITLSKEKNLDWLTIDPGQFNLSFHLLGSIFRQFQDRGFIKIQSTGGKGYEIFTISIEVGTFDFIQRGGFLFEEEVFKNSFSKLELELENLEKLNPTINFENATKLVGAIASGFDIYKNLNP